MGERREKGNYLSPQQHMTLDIACRPIVEVFNNGDMFLVGSVLERPDYRDVDVRLMLDDDEYARLGEWRTFLAIAVSAWLRQMTGLPIDFQFQDTTTANVDHDGVRNAIGFSVKGRHPDG